MKKGECECECNNGFGIASVVLGIIGSVMGIFIFPIAASIAGLAFGIVQYKKAKNAWAVWGIILSVLGILISVWIIWKLAVITSQFQQTIAACQADPSAPGCDQIASLLEGSA